MKLPNWQHLELDPNILREPSPDQHRIIIWLPIGKESGKHHWQRISNVPGAEITAVQHIRATAATSIRAHQQVRGLLERLLFVFGKKQGAQTWVLPNGETVDQYGERQSNLMLVWGAEEANPLDSAQIPVRWPTARQIQKLGPNLFLVFGVVPAPAAAASPPTQNPQEGKPADAPQPENPQIQAERLLVEARRIRDRGREASALTDLGIVSFRSGDARRAVALLEEALTVARQLSDRARETDVGDYLALALLAVGEHQRALHLLNQQLAQARASGSPYQEKLTLENLGVVHAQMRNHIQALAAYERALALARDVHDQHHQADLLWYLAIQHAELGRQDSALVHAEAAIELFRRFGNPHVGLLTDHVQRYHASGSASNLAKAGGDELVPPRRSLSGGWTTIHVGTQAGSDSTPAPTASDPSLLRMAISAAKSVTRFFSSGLQTASATSYQQRLQTCAACEYHTGVRCKLCGCFTSVKAWMPHESCPLNKWPDPKT